MTLSYPQVAPQNRVIKFSRYQEIFTEGSITQRVEADYFEEPMLLVGLPIPAQDRRQSPEYGLLIFTPVSGIRDTVNRVRRLMIYSSVFAILLTILVAYSWSKSLSNPLKEMSEFALSLSQGEFGKTIATEKDIEEIDNLGASINQMSITLKETIDNLVEERNKLEYVLTGMDEGVLAINKNREIILINDAAVNLLAGGEQITGQQLQAVVSDEKVVKMFNNVLEAREFYNNEIFIEENGIEKRILVHLTPIIIEDSEFWGVVGLFQDISERWRFEQLQKEFIANVSHDLKTPLSSIKGATELLLDDVVDGPEKRAKYLEMIFEESNRLENLVEEILNLEEPAVSGSGRVEKVEVNQLMTEAGMVFEKIISSENLNLEINTVEEECYIRANKEKLKQVLLNLLDNAAKFSPENTIIKMGAEREDDEIKICVSDQGIGISEDELENIWERFYKVDKARTPGEKGSGLGLAIVRQIVNEQGGRVFVKSRPDQGSTFGFYLKEIDKEMNKETEKD